MAQRAKDMRRFGRRVVGPPWGPNELKNQKTSNGAYIGIGALILYTVLMGIFAQNQLFGMVAGWGVVWIVGLFLFLVGYGVFILWFSKIEQDDLREIDLKLLAAGDKSLYLQSDETLQNHLLKNCTGVATESWVPSHIVEREHLNGKSWVFDNDGGYGETAILVEFAHQTMPSMLIGADIKPLDTTLRQSDIANKRAISGRLYEERLRLGYRQVTTFVRKMDEKRMAVYGSPNESTLVQKWIESNPELGQIVNMREFHNLAIAGNYALLQFETELPADKETYSSLEARTKQLLELSGGSYEKAPDKAADEIKKLKDNENEGR